MKVYIKGIEYRVQLLEKCKFEKTHGKDIAYLDKETRELLFRKDYIKKNVVIHEVTHAFINSLHLGSCSDLTINDFEEIICEMMEDHIDDIKRLSNQIFAYLKESENTRRKKK